MSNSLILEKIQQLSTQFIKENFIILTTLLHVVGAIYINWLPIRDNGLISANIKIVNIFVGGISRFGIFADDTSLKN